MRAFSKNRLSGRQGSKSQHEPANGCIFLWIDQKEFVFATMSHRRNLFAVYSKVTGLNAIIAWAFILVDDIVEMEKAEIGDEIRYRDL